MASLHDALYCLKPTTWDTVPQSPDELREYVSDIFKHSRLVAESLPDPPPYEDAQHNTEPQSTPRVIPSSARVGETDPDVTSLQKQWGKPIKMGGDNPLGIHVWKLSANDGGGSWFGRRSVHEGMSFTRWQQKISSEYDETLKVNRKKIEKGQTPDNCIRGIGAEEKVETMEVKGEDGSVIAQITLYHVSAQFPKPTAPRDFVTMMITSSSGLQIGGSKQTGRSWLMISKPCDHPDVPIKQGYTRGEYESVELIREIPRNKEAGSSSSSVSSANGKQKDAKKEDLPSNGASQNQDTQEKDDDSDPVEWIMVTRSDPGGSIPRWMVDKGTPRSVGADAAKFVDWAIKEDKPTRKEDNGQDTTSQGDDCSGTKSSESISESHQDDKEEEEDSDSESDFTDSDISHHGLIASVSGLISSSLERYAPRAVYDYMPHSQGSPRSVPGAFDTSELPTDDAESGSYKSAAMEEYQETQSVGKEPERASVASAKSGVVTPIAEEMVQNNLNPTELMEMTKNGKLTSNEKELAKLALRKRDIESKLDKIRSEIDNLHLVPHSFPSTPTKGLNGEMDSDTSGMLKKAAENRSATPASSSGKQSQQESSSSGDQGGSQIQTPTSELPAHMHKAASQLFNDEAKLLKQLRKIEASQLKVASKIETRRRKDAERSEKSKSRSEVDGLRQEVKDLKKEVDKLRSERQKWVDLVASLQAENTKLVAARKED
ncbi:hypothetical protein N7456_003265 [Penicillium angulare]|uniref:DUF3074 domain-containing protein n=1 Tax=Penicillium angulare TaxID=116970 RepID=A0A9W9KHE3_9EURO|nr:hypothetical protein N7456_003265 [Penicillium angulare]